jgi:predicted GIY-YIG superfamily endonuclease
MTIPSTVIGREKELKRWRRDRKIRLIEEQNPEWRDLYERRVRRSREPRRTTEVNPI